MRTSILPAVLAVGVLVLGGCGSGDEEATAGAGSPAAAEPAPDAGTGNGAGPPAAGDVVLATADTELGTVVVDGRGMTVYVFDRDDPGSGTSNCSDACLAAWPPVVAGPGDPAVEGVTGTVGTITRDDGTRQLTLEGRPLYLWQGDAAPGDTTGQGVQDLWWVVGPDGAAITDAPAGADLPGY